MQDLHSVGDGADRIFIGGDHRVRPIFQNQAMKCPRCDSLNTKFCYYNNYNLSQPRHYCRGCRRYWTKGGVLRNVPVGGGCRKTKKVKPKLSPEGAQGELNSNSNSSSESSSLTPPPPTNSSSRGTAVVTHSGSVADLSYITQAFKLPEPRFFVSPQTSTKPNFEQNSSEQETLPEIRNFTSMMNDSTILNLSNNSSENSSSFQINQHQQLRQDQQQWQWQLPKITTNLNDDDDDLHIHQISSGFLDHTVHADLSTRSGTINGGEFATIDWQTNGGNNQGLFQFTAGTVDHGFWSQNQWSDHDHSLY